MQVLIIASFLVGLSVFGRLTEGSWLAPTVLFNILWAGYMSSALLFVADPQEMLLGSAWILISCASVYFGCFVARWFEPKVDVEPHRGQAAVNKDWRTIRSIVFVLTLLGVMEVTYVLYRAGISNSPSALLRAIPNISSANRSAYGYGDLNQSFGEWLLFVAVYTGPLFGGFLTAIGSNLRDKISGVAPLGIACLVGILYGSRMGALFGISFWFAAYISGYTLGHARSRRHGGRALIMVLVATIVMFSGMSIISQVARYSPTTPNLDYDSIVSDPFGFIVAFCRWFSAEGLTTQERFYGYRSFWHIFKLTGASMTEQFSIDVGFSSSNIFTVFRGLIEDFGQFGSLIALATIGALGRMAFLRVSLGASSWVPPLTCTLAFVFMSMCFSVLSYTAPTIALLLFALCPRWRKDKDPAKAIYQKRAVALRRTQVAGTRQ